MNKFKIGDLVKIGNVKGSQYSQDEMYKFKGCFGRITKRHPDAEYPQLVKIEGTDHWWFDENILTPFFDNRRYIDAFLAGESVEVEREPGLWMKIAYLVPEDSGLRMRLAKSEEALAIEKEIDVLKENVVDLEKQKNDIIKQKNDIISRIKNQKSRISRREKKLKTLS